VKKKLKMNRGYMISIERLKGLSRFLKKSRGGRKKNLKKTDSRR
jgi:hypothetical protein